MPSNLFVNAKLWQPEGVFDSSFGMKDGHFDFTGSLSEAALKRSKYDKITDLGGKLVLPGLIDGHLHLVKGSLMRKLLDCTKIESIEELKDAVNNYSLKNDSGWVIGSNLDLNKIFAGYVNKTGNIIDDIFNTLPLYITNYDYHSAICNSKAFELTGLNSKLSDYSAEEIERTTSGKPTGLIRERSLNYIISKLPVPSLDKKADAVIEFIKVLHSYGITSVSDITLPEDIEVYSELYRRGELKIRINSYIPFNEFNNLGSFIEKTREINPDLFTISGFKTYWDGALGSETALFSMNYSGKDHNGYKTEMVQTGEIYELAKQIDASGKQMIIHAIGDLAVKEVLDLFASLPNTRKLRHRIEHAQHIQPADFRRFAELGVIASVQPVHLKYDAKVVSEKLPLELINYTHNYIHLIESGAVVNFGTDFPIVEVDPFENIRLAASRITQYGSFTPELSIPLHECIKGYTINNAYSNSNDSASGSISKGKAADFVIMEDDIFEMEKKDISGARVSGTYLSGEKVF
ncbi:MAG: amidohydrolase [Ignavibacteria bacterium]